MKISSSRSARRAIYCLACAAMMLFGSGCSTMEKWDKQITPPRKDAAVLIAVAEDGAIAVYNGKGQPFKRCWLCNDKACGDVKDGDKDAIKRLEAAGYCTSLVKATTLAPYLNISVQKTRVNPYCWTVIMAGYEYEMCVCEPNEVDPRCIGTIPPTQ
jgi:hypothetical protein